MLLFGRHEGHVFEQPLTVNGYRIPISNDRKVLLKPIMPTPPNIFLVTRNFVSGGSGTMLRNKRLTG
jgi:hypothetical protein